MCKRFLWGGSRRRQTLWCRSDTWGRRKGRQQDWVRRVLDCSTVPKELQPGQRGDLKLVTCWKSPVSCCNEPTLISPLCLITSWDYWSIARPIPGDRSTSYNFTVPASLDISCNIPTCLAGLSWRESKMMNITLLYNQKNVVQMYSKEWVLL